MVIPRKHVFISKILCNFDRRTPGRLQLFDSRLSAIKETYTEEMVSVYIPTVYVLIAQVKSRFPKPENVTLGNEDRVQPDTAPVVR